MKMDFIAIVTHVNGNNVSGFYDGKHNHMQITKDVVK